MSSVTNLNQAKILGHIRALYRDEYHCDKKIADVKRQHKNASEDYINSFKKARGCGVITKNLKEKINNIEYYTCLCEIEHEDTYFLLSMSRHFENGIMPFNGSLMDQPAQIIELLEMVYSAKIQEEAYVQKKASERANK